jgi:hypothetical protein
MPILRSGFDTSAAERHRQLIWSLYVEVSKITHAKPSQKTLKAITDLCQRYTDASLPVPKALAERAYFCIQRLKGDHTETTQYIKSLKVISTYASVEQLDYYISIGY